MDEAVGDAEIPDPSNPAKLAVQFPGMIRLVKRLLYAGPVHLLRIHIKQARSNAFQSYIVLNHSCRLLRSLMLYCTFTSMYPRHKQ